MRTPIRSPRFRFASAISAAVAAIACGAAAQDVPGAISALDADTAWQLHSARPLNFPTHHPQGMTRVDDRWFLSSVEVIDRAAEKGVGHLFEFDAAGNLVHDIKLADGPIYHPGGIDYDGEAIWLSLAEYRPDSNSIVYRIDPATLHPEPVFRFADHLGAVVHLPDAKLLVAVSWGSRRIYEWEMGESTAGPRPIDPATPRLIHNPSHYVAYQDMQQVAPRLVLAGGVRGLRSPGRGTPPVQFGGIDLLEFPGATLRHGLPMNLVAPSGTPMNQNPFYAEFTDGKLRLWFVPEDDRSTLYVYEPR